MKNGQLKPVHNVQTGTENQQIDKKRFNYESPILFLIKKLHFQLECCY